MAHQVHWTRIIVEEFIKEACLTEEEEMVLRTRVKGWTRTRQSMELDMSLSTIDRIIKRLKIKYDEVQQYDPLLPKRKYSSEEVYMDTH